MNYIRKGVLCITPENNPLAPTKGLFTSLLFVVVFLFSNSLFAQDQFLWVGAVSNTWELDSNWVYYPYGDSTRIYPAPYFPGEQVGSNPHRGDDIAVFTNITTADCLLTFDHTDDNTALRIGGIHVQGFGGVIKQSDGNRFNVAETVGEAGGSGFWDGTTPIASTHPDLGIVNGDVAYQAFFNFAAGGEFLGGGTIVGGISPSYSLLFAVPLTINPGSGFTPPKDETRIRHNAFIYNGALFDNMLEGAVVLSNRSAGAGTRQYSFANVHFWDLKVTPNGAAPRTKEFIDGTCVVENDFKTTGLLGELYAGSHTIIMNATSGVEVHVENDIILGNVDENATLTGANAYGNLVIVMNGNGNQDIDHSHSDIDFQGNLPYLRIDKPTGQVTLKGPVTVNGHIEFVSGRVRPANPSTQTALTKDVFVLNSNATVSGMSDASFCTGAIRARTGKSIELPIGKASTYRPALVRAVSGVSVDNSIQNMYRAEYFEAIPAESPSMIDTDELSQVSICEVWAIHKEAAAAADPWTFNLELSYNPSTDPNCTGFIYPATNPLLAVARWNHAVEWVSHGNGGAFVASNGDETVRTALSVVSSDFQRSDLVDRPDLFTFAELEAAPDPCEVHICVDYCQVGDSIYFTPNIVYGTGSSFTGISWDFGDGGTSTDLNPSHAFTTSGVHFVDVIVGATNGVEACSTNYTFGIFYNNCSLPVMESIRQTTTTPKEPKEERTKKMTGGQSSLLVTPNPSSDGQVQFLLETEKKGSLDYAITNQLGQTVLTGQLQGNEYVTIKTATLPAGTYVLTVQVDKEPVSQQFVITK